ncbi:hypothetical protein QUF64_01255 [Anaerolineales bacterium HSG6]|nr:hypothetical protein [Anaerolineales bacterium HSG6]MDM8530253.1 hypothetical protein [Anaerolineales bacterium HSG25]
MASSLNIYFQSAQRRASEMATLTEIGRKIAKTFDRTAILEKISLLAQELLHSNGIGLYLQEPDSRCFGII